MILSVYSVVGELRILNSMEAKMNASEIKNYAKSKGADLIGVAPIERFAGLPADKSPLSIFPECKSVIVVGRRILRGAMRGIEEGTNFHSTYSTFGYKWLEDNFLSKTTYDLTCHIETQGFEAVPLFGYSEDGMPTGAPVAPGKPAPNVIVDLDFAAHAAGLGELGLGGFFITPKYGIRQRFAMILTDSELTYDNVEENNFCESCEACVKACPFGAIDKSKTIDYSICSSCPNGAMQGPGRGSRPDRIAAICGRTCMVRLEESGKSSNKFANKFRKRSAWVLDGFRRPVSPEKMVGVSDLGSSKQQPKVK